MEPSDAFVSWREPTNLSLYNSQSSLPPVVSQQDSMAMTDSSGADSDDESINGSTRSHSEIPITPFRRPSIHPDPLAFPNRPTVLRKLSNATTSLFQDRKDVTVALLRSHEGDRRNGTSPPEHVSPRTRGKRSDSIGSGLMALDIMEPQDAPWMSKLSLCSPRPKTRSGGIRPNRISLLLAEETHAVEREIALEREVQVILKTDNMDEKTEKPSSQPAPLPSGSMFPVLVEDDTQSHSSLIISDEDAEADGESLDGVHGRGAVFGNSMSSYSSYSSNDGMDPLPTDKRRRKLRPRSSFQSALGFGVLLPEDALDMSDIPQSPTLASPTLQPPHIPHLRSYRGIKRKAPSIDGTSRGNTPPPSFESIRSGSSSMVSSPNIGYSRSHPYAPVHKRHHRSGSGTWAGANTAQIARSKPVSIPLVPMGEGVSPGRLPGSPGGTPPPMDSFMGSPHHSYASPRFPHNYVQMQPGAMLNLTEAQEGLARTSIARTDSAN